MKKPYRWRVLIEELELGDGESPAWMLVTSCHRGDKWRQVVQSPQYYDTVDLALLAAQQRFLRARMEKSA